MINLCKEGYKLDQHRSEAVLEAILFTMGESVDIHKLAEVIDENVKTTRDILQRLKERYDEEERGITITEFENAYQMCTNGAYYDYLIKIAKAPRKYILTETLLETLSIVAYKQPVTRLDIEKIRGVSCDHAVNKLIEYDLITEVGRLDAPGRPLLFGTTEQFLRSFGVSSLEELPELNPEQINEFKNQAEKEIHVKLDI